MVSGKSTASVSNSSTTITNMERSFIKTIKAALWFSVAKQSNLTWEELNEIEDRRRRVLRRHNKYFFVVLCHWDGTVLRLLATDLLMWFTMLTYVGVRIQIKSSLGENTVKVFAGNITVIGGFLSFFLVFFVVEANKRYFEQYKYAMIMKGRIFDVASLAKAYLPKASAHRIVRYMNAAHVAGYTGLSDTYNTDNFFDEMNKRCHFLNEHELIRIREIDMDAGGAVNLELITWVLADVKKAQTDGHIDSLQSNQMREYVIEFRRAYADLANIADQPISFFYVHFIILLSSLYLPLFAVSAAYNVGGKDVDWSVNLIGGLTVWLQTIFVIGLRTLGLVLQDPFGSDVEDLSVIHYVNFTWKVSNRILAGNNPNPLDIGVEEEVIVSRAPLGAAWDPVSKTVAAEKAMSKSNLDPHNYEDEDDEEGGLTSVEGVEIMITPSSKNKS